MTKLNICYNYVSLVNLLLQTCCNKVLQNRSVLLLMISEYYYYRVLLFAMMEMLLSLEGLLKVEQQRKVVSVQIMFTASNNLIKISSRIRFFKGCIEELIFIKLSPLNISNGQMYTDESDCLFKINSVFMLATFHIYGHSFKCTHLNMYRMSKNNE